MPAVDSVGAIATFQQSNQLATNESINESINESVNQSVLMPWAAITLGAKGEQLSELAELINAGAIGFADGRPLMNKVLLRRLLEYAQPLQKPIALWPCDIDLARDGIAREGVDSIRLGLAGTSAIAETTALATMLEYLVEVPALVHIMRVSTARSVDLIREAKSRNLPISASVPWHHLLFDTTDLESYSPHLKQDPPLGTPRDRTALIEAVSEGVIDAIAIDHSPYSYEEKTVSFKAAPPGAIGLELALPLLWQTFVSAKATDKRWSPMQLWQSLSEGPAQCLGQSAGQLEVGAPAELALFNPAFEWDVAADTLESLSSNTPWLSKRIAGRVTQIWNQ
ncbi:MAG: amidohydrolase family protein [Cyanobacteria bacterium J06554_3]